ncbi:non-specific lipid transfer protein GPI-anchored 5-like isoform X2 [Salvia miltiorrhiza]|uniref:non-specific lipid transfer protein GPI-anchored 5-like isoform X2 n=1 Tax=Salvia miltiorrhiza TaxID=226208 RepID=UPI0025ACB177|nr:non-specific lipid transfer protein GPI-anchored 5-like isoform X2 [Salvia miltiorrhiza]
MAAKSTAIVGAFIIFAVVSTVVIAQSDCTSVIVSMASCLSYVSGSAATPSTSCCSALANVVKTQPRCLCTIVNGGGSSLGVSINQTLALGLPGVCKVDTPPTSRCNESAPPESVDGSPAGSPSVTGSKTTPSDGATSSGSTTNINIVAKIIFFITAAYASSALKIF